MRHSLFTSALGAFSALALVAPSGAHTGPLHAGPEAGPTPVDIHLSGRVEGIDFRLERHETLIIDEDTTIVASGEIVLDGMVIVMPRTAESWTVDAPDLELIAARRIVIRGEIFPGDGADMSATRRKGGEGGDLTIKAPELEVLVPELRSGNGGHGGLGQMGGDAGGLVVSGTITSGLTSDTLYVGGEGGDGGDGTWDFGGDGEGSDGGEGGDVTFECNIVIGPGGVFGGGGGGGAAGGGGGGGGGAAPAFG